MKENSPSIKPTASLLHSIVIGFMVILVNCAYSQTSQESKLQEIKTAVEQGKHNEAMQLANQNLPLAIENNDSSLIVGYSYYQSKIYQRREQLDSAVNSLIFAYRYAKKTEDEVKINYQLGELLLEMGAYELSIPYLKELVEKETDLKSKFYHYNLLGRAYILTDKSEEGIQNFRDQLAIAKQLKDPFLINNANQGLDLNNLMLIYFIESQ